MWGILNTLNSSEVDEVTIDSAANWKPTKNLQPGIKVGLSVHLNCNDHDRSQTFLS